MFLIEIGVVVALIFLNGLLAMSELAIVSSRRPRLEASALNGSRGGLQAGCARPRGCSSRSVQSCP